MALTGIQILKMLPKKNCGECSIPTCLAFAMQIAAKKVELGKCPHVSEEAKQALDSASRPPIRLVTIGSGEQKLEVGNETVMFRHEETFYHPTGIGFLIEDTFSHTLYTDFSGEGATLKELVLFPEEEYAYGPFLTGNFEQLEIMMEGREKRQEEQRKAEEERMKGWKDIFDEAAALNAKKAKEAQPQDEE